MLSYAEALARILEAAGSLPAESLPFEKAVGRVPCVDVLAPEDVPSFDNSAVDGFAVRGSDVAGASPDSPVLLPVSMEIPAGACPDRPLPGGSAARIMTGAMVPEGADHIVMVEDTRAEEGGGVVLLDPGSPSFVRNAGSDIRRGSVALVAGVPIGPAGVGLLASLGVLEVACVRRPRVGLLSTGDELVEPLARSLPPGKIRNSNTAALAAAIHEAGAVVAARRHARDDAAEVEAAFDVLLDSGCDLILSSGGVSVGAYDVVRSVVERRGRLDFWRIAVKPGKPLAFGTLGTVPFLGLPGNPVSSLVTFELFVRPLLRRLGGRTDVFRPEFPVRSATAIAHDADRREWVRVTLELRDGEAWATPTGGQGSHRASGMAAADALMVVPEGRGSVVVGELLSAIRLRD
ncbi:MAG: gephyrin-like molybdotransferase Glp [Armatimonadota bacterium]